MLYNGGTEGTEATEVSSPQPCLFFCSSFSCVRCLGLKALV